MSKRTTQEQDRIRLAEAMGWTATRVHAGFGIPPSGGVGGDGTSYEKLPDPLTDANDCEALIQHLVPERIDWIEITHGCFESDGTPAASVCGPSPALAWRGSDWKQGVCYLALTVLGAGSE